MNSFTSYINYNNQLCEKHFYNLAVKAQNTAGNDPGLNYLLVKIGYKVLYYNKYNQNIIPIIKKACQIVDDPGLLSNAQNEAITEILNN
tara:strand:+ start:59 stop:325 length:267 start_codon:yes stop_codon:yes gene_type:complete